MSTHVMNRREFIGGAAKTAGGIAIVAAVPWLAAPVGAERPMLATPSDFQIDDMWGAYPRYAERIDCPRAREPEGSSAAAAGSIDALFHV